MYNKQLYKYIYIVKIFVITFVNFFIIFFMGRNKLNMSYVN